RRCSTRRWPRASSGSQRETGPSHLVRPADEPRRMSTALRAAAQRYGSVARAYRRFWAPGMVAHAKPMISAIPLASDDTIADLGCGVGVIGARLAKRARTVVGIDVAEGMLRQAPAPVQRVAGDIASLQFGDETLGGAISTFALQHVPRTGRAFK